MVDAVVRQWLKQMIGEEAARGEKAVDIRILLVCFYIDDGVLATADPAFLQRAFDALVELFDIVGLRTNTVKTEAMTFIPGRIRTCLSERAYVARMEGLTERRASTARVSCRKCGADLAEGSLQRHMLTQHGIHHSYIPPGGLTLLEEGPEEFVVTRNFRGHYECPVPGCSSISPNFWALRRHFAYRHPQHMASCPIQGCPAKCECCGMQTTKKAIQTGHYTSTTCLNLTARKKQLECALETHHALQQTFTAYETDELKRVDLFKYLGRMVSYVDSDVPAMRAQMKKARGTWRRVSKVLREENVPPAIGAMFYKAVVMAVLLYGSETWVLPASEMKALEGFHVASARILTGMRPKQQRDGTWKYPKSEAVLKAANLRTIGEYIAIRRSTIARKIAERPVLQECKEARRQRGTAPRLYWWEQELDFTLDNEHHGDAEIVEDQGWAQPNGGAAAPIDRGVDGDSVLRRRQRRELDEELAGN